MSRLRQAVSALPRHRVPPGQILTTKFPVLHVGNPPVFNPQTWTFKVIGEVEHPLTLTWEQVLALPSTASDGRVSRIVASITPGGGVVTTRGHVHWVVTEYGAVNLWGKTLRQRAEALISIAHPDFHHELFAAAAETRRLFLGHC